MRRSLSILPLVILSALSFGVFSAPVTALAETAKPNWSAIKMVGKAFRCTIKLSTGSTMPDCWTFGTGIFSTQHFDLVTAYDEFGCTCGTTGSFKSPKFNSSADVIECDDGGGNQLTGTIKGKKLSAQSVNGERQLRDIQLHPHSSMRVKLFRGQTLLVIPAGSRTRVPDVRERKGLFHTGVKLSKYLELQKCGTSTQATISCAHRVSPNANRMPREDTDLVFKWHRFVTRIGHPSTQVEPPARGLVLVPRG